MVQRTNHHGGHYFNTLIESGFRLGSMTRTIVDGEVMDASWPPILYIDAAAAADLVLPTPSERTRGLTFFVTSLDDTHTIDLEYPANTIIQAVASGESYMLHCDGSTWRVIG